MRKGDKIFKITYSNDLTSGCYYILQHAKNSERLVTKLLTKLRKDKKNKYVVKLEITTYEGIE